MMRIGWIRIDNSKDQYKFGGSIYNERSRIILSKLGRLSIFPVATEVIKGKSYLQLPSLFKALIGLRGDQDVWVRDFYSAVSKLFDHTTGKSIVLIHHIDTTTLPRMLKIFFLFYEKMFYMALRRSDAIVVMSKYWRDHFLALGFRHVYTVYNPIDFEKMTITARDVEKFRKKYQLSHRPIIYLGNCRPYKGVVEAYEALKDLDVQFVTSGHRSVSLPVQNLVLEHKEQLILQKLSTIAIAMSLFKEGWSMTVHESMYMKTPVIGTGSGGMGELLRGGKQIQCRDFSQLKKHVVKLLNNSGLRKKIGNDGHRYAKQFTRKRFEKDWAKVIQEINR